ncbi:MAG: N-methyl-D-aspartate receptor subunit [Phycisphaerales bacterium]|nr:N-methyl-D-aspartate receptor subunit [Phycisphaerales bacterium]
MNGPAAGTSETVDYTVPPMSQPPTASQTLVPPAISDRLREIISPLMHGRPYHNVDHVEACLKSLARHREMAEDPGAVELAIWFHDARYDPTRSDNEAQSAELAGEVLADLGYSPATVLTVRHLIMDTKHDRRPATPDGQLLADIDLLILSDKDERFNQYEQAIREEYHHVAEIDFARGRARVLRHFLDREVIYYRLTDREPLARRNLERAIAKWDVR